MNKIYRPSLLYHEGKFTEKAVLVEAGSIKKIGDFAELAAAHPQAAVEDWNGLALLPGTVNAHNHAFQSLLRGLAVDRPFLDWRDEALYFYSPILTPQDLYTGALFAFGEMMRYGVTTVCDFFYLHNNGLESDEAIIQAARDTGIRLVLARTMYDWAGAPLGYRETIEQAVGNIKALAKKYSSDPMVKILPAPHSLHAASPEMIKAGHALAKELGTPFHIHVAEEPFEVEETLRDHGLRPVEYLHKLGVLDESMVAIHAVWLTDEEVQLMGSNRAKLAYCPSSNMFLADGVTKVTDLMKAGTVVALGSDGACSNNRISVFEEMRMAALLQKVSQLNATTISSRDVFAMGTTGGGTILDLPVGEIRENAFADFVGVDLSDLSLQPLYSVDEQLLPNIVYSMQPNAIARVVVNGVEQVRDAKLINMTQAKINEQLAVLTEKFREHKKKAVRK